ncbi:MAG TPA: hypothetical protein VHA33_05470 [Candidatus Angelobacter sp.]|jgi:hypothetical protein|nr:hypothetical protein [Candidatus Angelobacter sp.]
MPTNSIDVVQQAELGDLLAGTAKAVVQAQKQLDTEARESVLQYVKLPDGEMAIPPLWYTVKSAAIEVQLSATISGSELVCRTLNPHNVSLFGYEASAGTRIRLLIGPAEVVPIKTEN